MTSKKKAAKAHPRQEAGRAAKKVTKSREAPARRGAAITPAAEVLIRCWSTDPGAPNDPATPEQRPAPALDQGRLPIAIAGATPTAALYEPGTKEFRFWAAADALARASSFWSSLFPGGIAWNAAIGPKLRVQLDYQVEELNAYYDRRGLHFRHATTHGHVVYSGESPDAVCHELGHAVLDGLRPQLFNAPFAEVAAFHESFGDISALLSALQLQNVREAVLKENSGQLYRSSRLSKLAEQLGWAVRQSQPDAVEVDCLRNAVNSFFYQDPSTLPPRAPATSLSTEPHSFSRVFTAAFFEGIGSMFKAQSKRDQASLASTSRDAALLLTDAAADCPVVPSYFSQIAAHVIEADNNRFEGKYGAGLRNAFVGHGVLSLDSANAVSSASVAPSARLGIVGALPPGTEVAALAIPGARFGLYDDLVLEIPVEPKRYSVAGAGPDRAAVQSPAHDDAARSFVEDLFRRGRVDLSGVGDSKRKPRSGRLTHAVVKGPLGLTLERQRFACSGLGGSRWD